VQEEFYRHRATAVRTLMMDYTALVDAAACAMPGAPFARRLPVGAVETLRADIAIYLLLRRLVLKMARHADEALPLMELANVPVLGDEIDIGGQPVMACKVCPLQATPGQAARRGAVPLMHCIALHAIHHGGCVCPQVVTLEHPLGQSRLLVVDAERLLLVELIRDQPGRGVVRIAEELQHVAAAHDSGNPVCCVPVRTLGLLDNRRAVCGCLTG
jgi:hypothetical protein